MPETLFCPSCAIQLHVEPPVLVVLCQCGQIVTAKSSQQVKEPNPPASSDVDYYVVLGVQRDATVADIKSAYRSRARDTHPDMGGDQDEFLLVQAAYETLGDADRRQAYDQQGQVNSAQSLWIVPDVLAIRIDKAATLLSEAGFTFRVVAVEVPARSRLSGLVVGQYPYPGWEIDAPVVGVIIAVSQASSIWERIGRVVAEFSTGFNSTFWSHVTLTASTRKAIGPGSLSARSTGERTGEVLGDVVVWGAQAVVAYVGIILLFFASLIVIFALVFIPVVGLILGGIWLWLFWKFWTSLRRRRRRIVDHRKSR